MSNTHWKKLANPNYLGAYSLEDEKDIVLTIARVVQEPVMGTDGKKEDCIVCYWKENEKPMILNATNCKTITKVTGTPYIEQWAGKRIQIGIENVRAFGDVVPALRVRKNKPRDTAQEKPIPCEVCGQVIRPAFGMSVSQWVAYSNKQLKKAVCEDCANKIAAEKNAQKQEESADAEADGQ